MKVLNFLIILFFIALLLTECDDSTNITQIDDVIIPSANVSYAKYIQPVFNAKCNYSGCHDDGTKAGGLSLTTWANTTSDYLVVAPGFPDNSKLVWAIKGQSTSPMPPVGYYPLTKNQIDGIVTWIKEGAKKN
ncbi:c-type cytochrome domain-containing protein [Melioribacteraceae bacterium 4301-Me]|uniref:c-type cytochrome domain-containing protein n=1 Tax=Pyranulibacter aquaticus TaxID=3163344 RepID=UPI003596BFB6